MPTLNSDTEFDAILQDLPADLEQLAHDHHAFSRARKVRTPQQLMRLVLAYCGLDWSARDIAAQFTLLHEPITDEAIVQRLAGCTAWVQVMLQKMVCGAPLPRLDPPVRVLVCDGSTSQGPGATGIEHRVHLALDLVEMSMCDVEVTDAHTAERLDLYALREGDIVLGDGGYARVPQLCRVAERGARPVVRINAYSVIAQTSAGERIDWVRVLADQEPDTVRTLEVVVRSADEQNRLQGWVHAYRMTDERAGKERRLVKMRNKKRTPKAETLVLAGWVLIFTTISPEQLSGEVVLRLYRCRWQVELAFKRYKSLLDLDELRARHNSPLSRVWVMGKMLYAALLERRALRGWSRAGIRLDAPRLRSWWRILKLTAETVRPLITGAAFWKREAVDDAIRMLSERSRRRRLQQLPSEIVTLLATAPPSVAPPSRDAEH